MANELRTDFIFNDAEANKRIDLTRKNLFALNNDFNNLGKNTTVGKTIANDFTHAGRSIDSVKQKTVSLKNAGDDLLKKAQADIRRMQAENIKAEQSLTKQIEREAKLQADIKIREGRRAANEALRTLRQPDKANPGAGGVLSGIGSFIVPAAVGASAFGFGKESLQASREAANAQRLLRATTIETGIAYDKLSASARKFGEDTLQSNRAAQNSFAQIVTFANSAGRAEKLDEFRTKFADLAAAKGIDPKNLGEIAKQLNALTDEATDKLLGANPSAFYDKFAKSIGKTANSLSDAEKRAAVFDEVLKRGALFSGEAERRVNASASALDRLSVKFENVKEKAGGAAVTIVEFTEFLSKVAVADPSLYTSNEEREASANNRKIQQQKRVDETVKTLRAQDEQIRKALANPGASLENFALSKFNLADNFFNPEARQKAINAAVETAKEVAKAYQTAFAANIADQNISVGLAELGLKEFYRNQNLYDPQTRRQLAEASEKAVLQARQREADRRRQEEEKQKRDREAINARVSDLGKGFNSVFDSLGSRQNQNNPFAAFFTEAINSIDVLRAKLKGLSPELQEFAVKAEQSLNRDRLFDLRADNRLQILDLRETAERFRNPNQHFTANDRLQKQLNVLDSLASSETERAAAERRLLSLSSGLNPNQLNADLRERIATAADNEAARRERSEREGLETAKRQLEVQAQIAENGKQLLEIAKKEGLAGLNKFVELQIVDKTNGAVNVLGAAPTSADTAALYNEYQGALR